MAVVMASHFPAPLPIPAMAGVIRAKIKTGMKNPRKFPNRPLKVAKTRPSQSGKNKLHTMPEIIATTMRKSSEEESRRRSIRSSLGSDPGWDRGHYGA